MSTTYIDSNLAGKNSTETITGFVTVGDTSTALVGATVTSSGAISGTTITGSGAIAGADVRATNYVRVGATKYIFSTSAKTEATVVANATAVSPVATIMGSLSLGAGQVWLFVSNTHASPINLD